MDYVSRFMVCVMQNMRYLHTLCYLVYLEWMKCDDTCDCD